MRCPPEGGIARPAVSTAPGLLDLQSLTVTFRTPAGPLRAVDRVDIRIAPAETVALVGESGSGKSVTSLAIMGLLGPDATVSGSRTEFRTRAGPEPIDLQTLDAKGFARLRGNEIAMIFQEPMTSLNPLHTIGDQIAEPLRIHYGLRRSSGIRRAVEMLALVGIPDPGRRVDSYPHELSGGMRQRVMIAMALVCDPKLLIADEPTTALDVTIQVQILDLFRQLREARDQAILFITHDLGVVAETADRVYVMYAGQVVESGSVSDILRRPRHPYTRGLLAALPRVDRPTARGKPLFAIPGRAPDLRYLPRGCRFQTRCPSFTPGVCDGLEPPLEPVDQHQAVRCVRWREVEEAAVAAV